ncbi:MAG: Flp pilus assembly protein CpaB [Acetobacteraceae bacterium]|nr:Flp pilus assembly protein CpaB [Acetobacteraceae bacterium]
MMYRIGLFVVMALGLFGFGTVAWVSVHPHTQGGGQAEAALEQVAVIVAAHPLRAGTLLKLDDVSVVKLAPNAVPDNAMRGGDATLAELKGSMLRRALHDREPLLDADILHATDRGFLAAVLAPGMRAITVAVDSVTGAAGLISPGDHVDVLLIQTIDDATRPAGQRVAAQTVLNDIRVIAIDQRMVEGEGPESGSKPATTVTLEVASEQAERVVVAGKIGRLSLVVRSAEAGADVAIGQHVTWASDVSPALLSPTPSGPSHVVRVYRGSGDAKEFHF